MHHTHTRRVCVYTYMHASCVLLAACLSKHRQIFTVERRRDEQSPNISIMADEFDDFFDDSNTSSEQNKTEEKNDEGTLCEKRTIDKKDVSGKQ